MDGRGMTGIRWGLCCQFVDEPIRFRQATHRHVSTLGHTARVEYLGSIARANAIALAHAIERCAELGFGAFRITSQIIPLATHPVSGYTLDTLADGEVIAASFASAGLVARQRGIRLSFHPDQFVVLNSEREAVIESSVRELDFQARMAVLIGAEALTLHAGGATGGVSAALERLERGLDRLSPAARALVALENDDRLFTVRDLLPLCHRARVPLVYDVHHHRCHPDGMSVVEATAEAGETWGTREPWVHVASPRDGWTAPNPRPHADYIDPADFPEEWFSRRLTVDVEAKAKDRAVLAIRDAVEGPRALHAVE